MFLLKPLAWEKSGSQVMFQKPRATRIQDSLNYNISETSWGMKLNFCVWLRISNKLIQSFQMGVVSNPWLCPNLYQIVSQVHLLDEWICKIVFCLWLWIHRSCKFVQSFQLGMPKVIENNELAIYQKWT